MQRLHRGLAAFLVVAAACPAMGGTRGLFKPRMDRLEDREMPSASPWMGDAEMYDYFITHGSATDSASAGTAISTGIKTDSGNIAWASGDPADGKLITIAEDLRDQRGFAIGVVSTVPFTHATPAAFVSHNVHRNNYHAIGHEIISQFKPEVVIGGGFGTTTFLSDADLASLVDGSAGYTFVQRTAGVDGGGALRSAAAGVDLAAGEKLFGLFGTPSGNWDYYELADMPGTPHISRPAEDPRLADAVEVALEVLSQDPDGLFVMFEQGDIDWSNHANDYAKMVGGVYDLDQAVRAAERFVDRPDDAIHWNNTLMIATSDHANSYLRLHTFLGKGDLPDAIEHGNPAEKPDGAQVTYSSTNHTNELVTVSARGRGAQLLARYAGADYRGTNIIDNTDIHKVMSQAVALGAKHIILFIGDGMHLEHEIAASRYLTGHDFGLAWHGWGLKPRGYSGFCATWDVDTYDHYAALAGEPKFDPDNPDAADPILGYDPAKGGVAPERLDRYGAYVTHTLHDVLDGDRPWKSNVQKDLVAGLSYRHSDGPRRKQANAAPQADGCGTQDEDHSDTLPNKIRRNNP